MNVLRIRWGLSTLVVGLVLIASFALRPNQANTPLGSVPPAEAAVLSTVFVPVAPKNSSCDFGIKTQKNFLSLWGVDAKNEVALKCAEESGAGSARVFIGWDKVEGTQGVYDWSAIDKEFSAIASHGLTPIVNLSGAPAWATDATHPDCGPFKSPEVLTSFGDFVFEAVKRYSVAPYMSKRWIMINEPDGFYAGVNQQGGGCWGADPKPYGEMLRAVYPRVHAADPESRVVIGALAMDFYKDGPYADPTGLFKYGWLRLVLDSQKSVPGEYFDQVAFNSYFWFRHAHEQYGTSVQGKAGEIRQTLADFGKKKPLLVAEVGQIIDCPGQAPFFKATNADVARAVPQLLGSALVDNGRPEDGIETAVWFNMQDNEECWGLLDKNGASKVQYSAFRVFAKLLGDARLTRNDSEPTYGTPPPRARACTSNEANRIAGPFICDALQWYKFTNDRTQRDISLIYIDPGNVANQSTASRAVQFSDNKLLGIVDHLGSPYPFTQANGQVSFTVTQAPVYVIFSR